MAGIRYEEMPYPKRPFRPDRDSRSEDGKVSFETLSFSLNEDGGRASSILKALEQFPRLFGDEAIDLANRLNEGVETHVPPPTLASHLYMRDVRIRVFGNLWPVVEDANFPPAATVTLRPTGMWVPAYELMEADPYAFMRRLREDLRRAGFNELGGYLLAGLHSEFDVNRGGYDFHYHLIVNDKKAEAIDKLRGVRRFKAGRVQAHELDMPESARVHRSEKPLTNLPSPLTYVLQSSHPHRPTTVDHHDVRTRSKRRCRIPEPHHTLWLLWMDRWSVSDMLFSVGMIPTKTGFQITF